MRDCPKNPWSKEGETLEPGEWRAVSLDFNATCYSELTKAALVVHLSHGVGKERVERFDQTQVYGHVVTDVLYQCAEERAIHHWSSSGRMFIMLLLVVVVCAMSVHLLKDHHKGLGEGGSSGGQEGGGTNKPSLSSPPGSSTSTSSTTVATVTNASKQEMETETEKRRETPLAAVSLLDKTLVEVFPIGGSSYQTSELLIQTAAEDTSAATEQKNVWLRLVNGIMHPTPGLLDTNSTPLRFVQQSVLWQLFGQLSG